MKILFIGDVVGSPGRKMITDYVPRLKDKYKPQVTIINGENAASGKGITEKIYKQFLNIGAQVVTLGNHTWNKRDIFEFIDNAPHMIRLANFSESNTRKGMTFLPPTDCPFKKADELIEEAKKRTSIIFVDFHGEATSEKQAMGWYLDGRVSAVVGTHTHTQTADNRILPQGTAFITDVGMTGPYDSILGVEKETIIKRFLDGLPARFEVDTKGSNQLNRCYIEIDNKTGIASKIERIMINNDHPFFD